MDNAKLSAEIIAAISSVISEYKIHNGTVPNICLHVTSSENGECTIDVDAGYKMVDEEEICLGEWI
jgi:hypothetical protein